MYYARRADCPTWTPGVRFTRTGIRTLNMTEKDKEKPLSFEQALGELEQLVEQMESGDLSLEDSLASFERGVQLTRTCQDALKAAEQRVQILSANHPDADLEPFDRDD